MSLGWKNGSWDFRRENLKSFKIYSMSDIDHNSVEPPAKGAGKKPFIEPEMKEFDDLEKQVRGTLMNPNISN